MSTREEPNPIPIMQQYQCRFFEWQGMRVFQTTEKTYVKIESTDPLNPWEEIVWFHPASSIQGGLIYIFKDRVLEALKRHSFRFKEGAD